MKALASLFAFGALAIGSQSHAATIESCVNRVATDCSSVSNRAVVGMVYGDQCKIVQHGRETRFVSFVSRDSSRITSVNLKDCRTSSYTFRSGRITDLGALEGRLFLTLSSKRVAFVGRNNRILELNNAQGEPYVSVTSLSIDQANGSLILQREGNQRTVLDRGQIQNRIDQNKMTVLSESY